MGSRVRCSANTVVSEGRGLLILLYVVLLLVVLCGCDWLCQGAGDGV